MNKILPIITGILTVALIGCIIFSVMLHSNLADTQKQLADTKAQLEESQNNATDLEEQVNTAKNETSDMASAADEYIKYVVAVREAKMAADTDHRWVPFINYISGEIVGADELEETYQKYITKVNYYNDHLVDMDEQKLQELDDATDEYNRYIERLVNRLEYSLE